MKKLRTVFIFIGMFFVIEQSIAAWSGSASEVSSIRFIAQNMYGTTVTSFNCAGNTTNEFAMRASDGNLKTIYSTILSAYIAKKKIQLHTLSWEAPKCFIQGVRMDN